MNKLYENIIVISKENKTFRSLNATRKLEILTATLLER